MSDKVDLWMPIYIGDYFADTRRLSTEQHGAYLLLMFDYWKSGPLPDDDRILAQITGLSADAWGMHRAMLKAFFKVKDGRWTHKRIDSERILAIDHKSRRHERAKNAADARWNPPSNARGNARGNAKAMLVDCPSPSPSPSPSTTPSSAHEEGTVVSISAPVRQMVVDAWNGMAKASKLSPIAKLTEERRKRLDARLGEHDPNDLMKAIGAIPDAPFLMGQNDRGWKADFDWLVTPKGCTKLIEGSFHNRGKGKGSAWTA